MPAPRPVRVLLGPLVLAALIAPAPAGARPPAPAEPPGATGAPGPDQARSATRPLGVGSRGARVREVQRALRLTADGVFGPRTRSAVRRFQRRTGLAVTGRVDAATAQALSMRAPALVRRVQRVVGVPVDGRLTGATRRAIRAVESTAGLAVDGVPDPVLLRRLGIPVPTPVVVRAPATTAPPPASGAEAAWIAAARTKIGAPYASGAAGPDSFDCSGLVWWAMRSAGIAVPRTSFEQFRIGVAVARSQIRAGDLVFFDTAGPGASDVGIATGPASAISATTHGVLEHTIDSAYWAEHYVGARRVG